MVCPLGKLNPGSTRTAPSSSGRGRWKATFARTFSSVPPATLSARYHAFPGRRFQASARDSASVITGSTLTPPITPSALANAVRAGVRFWR